MAKVGDAQRTAMRDALVAAAATVLARKGVAATTVRDILAEADVAPATLYAYFAGKEALIQEVAERALNDHLEALVARGAGASPAALFGWLLDAALTRPDPGAAVLAELRGRAAGDDATAKVRRINRSVVALSRPLLQRLRDSGELAVDDVDAFAELLDLVWDGLSRRAATQSFVTSHERVGAVFLELLRHAALTDPPA